MIYQCNLHHSLLMEGLLPYNDHFIITLYSLSPERQSARISEIKNVG